MRPALALVLALVACGPTEAPAPEAGPVPGAVAPASAFTARADSLVEVDPSLRYSARIVYPQVEADGPLPPGAEAANAAIVDSVRALAAVFRPEPPPPGVSVAPYPVELEGDYDDVLLTDGLLSALVDLYAYTGGAHGTTFFLPLNLDLTTGRPIRLGDLFREGTPVGDTLAAHVERGVAQALAAQFGEPIEAARRSIYAAGLDDFRGGRFAFTLGPDALLVHVPPYQLAAYAAGSFSVPVPYAALRPFAEAGGPLARLGE